MFGYEYQYPKEPLDVAVEVVCWGVLFPILLPLLIIIHARKIRYWIPWLLFRRGKDPYVRNERDWPTSHSSFITMLVMRRRLFDPRLKKIRRKWILSNDAWNTPEWVIFDAVYLDRDLMSQGAERSQVWEKLDGWLDIDGPSLPSESSVVDYLKSRLNFIDPGFLALDTGVLLDHIHMCTRWLEKNDPYEYAGAPCSERLTKRVPHSEFEVRSGGAAAVRSYANGRAAPRLDYFQSEIERIKLRMLGGGELWEYHAPSMGGIALVRDGRVIDLVVTLYICRGSASK